MNDRIEQRFKNVGKSKTFSNIVRIFELNKRAVLDIGCTNGEFLIHFGPGSVGLTIVQKEVEYGKVKNLDIRFGNIESTDFDMSDRFDVIFANNLFEHMHAPHDFLLKIKRFLRPDGLLILGVPTIPKIVSLIRLRKFRGAMAVSHINFFTRQTLIHTVLRAGWKIDTMRGFHFSVPLVDRLLDLIYPHFYVVARLDPNWRPV